MVTLWWAWEVEMCALSCIENQHCYNLSHDLLFYKVTDDTGWGKSEDSIVYDHDKVFLTLTDYTEADWDLDDEPKNDSLKKSTWPKHVAAGSDEVETQEQMACLSKMAYRECLLSV